MIKIGIIGAGHWGPNHIRIFTQLARSEVLMCADLSQERLEAIKNLFPNVLATTDYREVLKNKDIDAVCIATPTDTHFSISKEALEKALQYYNEALKIAETEGDLTDKGHSLNNIALIWSSQGNYDLNREIVPPTIIGTRIIFAPPR